MNAVLPESNQDLTIHAPIQRQGFELEAEGGGSPVLGPPTRCCRRLRILSQGVKGHSGQGCALRIVQAPPRDPSCEIPMAHLLLSCPRYGQGAPGEQGGQPRPPSKSLEHWTQTRLPLPFSGEKRSILGPPRAPQGVWPRPWPPPTRCCGILFVGQSAPRWAKSPQWELVMEMSFICPQRRARQRPSDREGFTPGPPTDHPPGPLAPGAEGTPPPSAPSPCQGRRLLRRRPSGRTAAGCPRCPARPGPAPASAPPGSSRCSSGGAGETPVPREPGRGDVS